jgi:hypothetical protein
MRKIVIAEALVLAIFGLYLAVATIEPPTATNHHARRADGVRIKGAGQVNAKYAPTESPFEPISEPPLNSGLAISHFGQNL